MTGARILVTGAAGFIGTALCARLQALGAQVTAVVRPGTEPGRAGELAAVAWLPVELTDRRQLAAMVERARPEILFHLANGDHRRPAPGLADARSALADGPGILVDLLAALSEAAEPPRCVVRAASLAEYGPIPAPYREDQREEPIDSHAAAALAATRFGVMLAPRLPFALVNARLALTYGPGQSERFLVPSTIRSLLEGRPVRLERPNDRRDLIHVADVVDGLVALALTPFQPIVNLCTGIAPTMLEVVKHIAAEVGAPDHLIEVSPAGSPGGVADLRGCPDAARAGCGWQARIALEDGIARTVAAMRDGIRKEALAC